MKVVLSILVLSMSFIGLSQYDIEEAEEDSKKEGGLSLFELKQRIYVGGELGLSFSQGTSYIHLAPLIGYDITEKFSAGVSTMYQLYRYRTPSNTFNFHTYGGGIFSRFRPIEPLIMQVEYDLFNTNDLHNGNLNQRVNVPAFMAGLGFANSFGSGSYFQILLLYDFINDPNMPLPGVFIEELHLKAGMIWHLN